MVERQIEALRDGGSNPSSSTNLQEQKIATIPKTVKVLHRDYALLEYTPDDLLLHNYWGDHNPIHGEIRYHIAKQGSETVDTLLHEVLHAIARMMDVEFKDKNEEEAVIAKLATGLTTVLKDNPKFTTAIVELLN